MYRTKLLPVVMLLSFFQFINVANASSKLNVSFSPTSPVYNTKKTIKVDGTKIFDHSKYSVKLTNRYRKSLHMKSVIFKSLGNNQTSGLGDIVNKWPWSNNHILKPGKSISFTKVWGFTEDTPNDKMTSQFVFTYTLGKSKKEYVLTKDLVLNPQ
ncbi:MAG: hypothetical protein QM504_15400 [Pseudomonadota bacterium]